MSSDAAPDPDATPEDFVRRAELLADLGQYQDAAAELGYAVALDPDNRAARILLARVHLAAGQPAEALAATDPLIATASGDGNPPAAGPRTTAGEETDVTDVLASRAMALIDLRRFSEAAELATRILRLGPEDPDALCTGAALLSESRNGQEALNAAWHAVELAPERAQGHLVLGLVAARLGQFQLSERAYRKALELDPELAEVHHDIGVIRLEQRRYSEALASLAEAAAVGTGPGTDPGAERGVDRGAERSARRGNPMAQGVRALLHLGAGYALLVPVLVACAAAGSPGLGRLQALAMGVIGIGMLAVMATRLPGRPLPVLRALMSADRALTVAVYAVAAAPPLVLLYSLVGTPWLLVAAVIAGFAALLANALVEY